MKTTVACTTIRSLSKVLGISPQAVRKRVHNGSLLWAFVVNTPGSGTMYFLDMESVEACWPQVSDAPSWQAWRRGEGCEAEVIIAGAAFQVFGDTFTTLANPRILHGEANHV